MNIIYLPVTIVIPCADDIRIKTCLDSINEKVETIVVLNGATNKVREIVKSHKVKTVEIPERNLAKALNVGIAKSKNKKVIFMDADCRFERGAIRKLYQGLSNYDVVKGKVIFESNNFVSKIIAKVREYSYYDTPKPYNPFLGINKRIKGQIAGYFFDDNIHWTEDADMNTRLKEANIKVNYVFKARVFHPPLSLKHDLRSAFRYGIGKRIRVETGKANSIGTHFGKVIDIAIKKGFWAGIYYFIWNTSYALGYLYQIIFDPYKTRDY